MPAESEKRHRGHSVSSDERTIDGVRVPVQDESKKESSDSGDNDNSVAVKSGVSDEDQNLPPTGEDDFPDGGLRAWLVVLGVSVCSLSSQDMQLNRDICDRVDAERWHRSVS